MNVQGFLLTKIRLSYYLIFLIVVFGLVSLFTNETTLDRNALTLFSVNSFLYGFYISPIISSQRTRIDDLHKYVRIESSKLYEIALYSKRLEDTWHKKTIAALTAYVDSAYMHTDDQGEEQYEKLMKLLISYDGDQKDPFKEIMKSSFYVQQNRSEISRLLTKRVYRNEWIVMLILFSITITFILMIKLPDIALLYIVPPILCAGLSMLIVILAKMSALTHKRAKTIWHPLNTLSETHFKRIND